MSVRALPFTLPAPLEAELRRAYAEPPRAYHNFAHVTEVLGEFARTSFEAPRVVALAILFHDAVYVPSRRDNEQHSAELAERLIRAHLPEASADIPRVRELILLTARHGQLSAGEVDADAARFLDCDMAILGAEPARFASYERAIRTEYAHVSDPDYRAGRGYFLRALLARERIYLSSEFAARLEARARLNLAAALARLDA